MKRAALIFSLSVGLAGCKVPAMLSGAKEPTPYTFKLTADDIAKAGAMDCAQAWVTGDPAADLAAAKQKLDTLGVRVRKGENPVAGGTALRHTLWVDREVDGWEPAAQARLYSHELVHYCDRRKDGDADFDARYFHSAGRWVYEVRAYAQTFRTMRAQGVAESKIRKAIDDRIVRLRDKYWLHDIDAEQFEVETRRIFEGVLTE